VIRKVSMKRALVCGAGGFIASHLVRRLNRKDTGPGGGSQGPRVRPTAADDFRLLICGTGRLRGSRVARLGAFDVVYQLAADMAAWVHPLGRVRDHAQQRADQHQHDRRRARKGSSATSSRRRCVSTGTCARRAGAEGGGGIPALPTTSTAGKALCGARALAYGASTGWRCASPGSRIAMPEVRGPAAGEGACRHLSEGGRGTRWCTIEVWAMGSDSLLHLRRHMVDVSIDSPHPRWSAANIGSAEYVSVAQLVQTVADVAGRRFRSGMSRPVVCSRATSATSGSTPLVAPAYSLRDGIARTYPWVHAQVEPGSLRRSSPALRQRRGHPGDEMSGNVHSRGGACLRFRMRRDTRRSSHSLVRPATGRATSRVAVPSPDEGMAGKV